MQCSNSVFMLIGGWDDGKKLKGHYSFLGKNLSGLRYRKQTSLF